MNRSSVISITRAFASTGNNQLPSKSGTSILLLHAGQPHTPYYTRHHLNKLWANYKIPTFMRQPLTDAYYNSSKLLRKAVSDCETYPILNEVIDGFSKSIERSVATITPEFSPVRCRCAFLYDAPEIETRVEEIIEEGTDSLMAISLHPFESDYLTKPMLSAVKKVLDKRTKPFGSGIDINPYVRVALNSPVSFNYLPITNIGTNESIIQYWAERLCSNLDEYDSVIFTTSLPLLNRRKFVTSFSETARRVMYVLYDSYPRAVPWRIAFYSPWDQVWPPLTLQTIQNQVKNLRKQGRNKTLVVPFALFFQDFDTETILPSLCSQPNVNLLAPDANDKALTISITELVKNSLLQQVANQEELSMNKILV